MTPGSVILGFGPSGSFALYLTLGMVAAVNPCGFAMLPAYLSYFLGLDTTTQSQATPDTRATESSATTTMVQTQRGAGTQVAMALRVSLAVSAGFLAVFAAAGMAVRHTSLPVYEYVPWISLIIGLALLGLGVAMLFGFELIVHLPRLNRGGRDRTLRSMFLFGVSYAIASLGCTLPIFLAAVAGTMARDSVVDGVMVFGIYGLGMTLVLGGLTVALALARHSVVNALRASRAYVNRVAGGLVALAGLYVIYYGTLELRTYRAEGGTIPSSGITDTVTGWSYDIQDWVERTGSVRIGLVLAAVVAVAVLLAARRRRSRTSETPASAQETEHARV